MTRRMVVAIMPIQLKKYIAIAKTPIVINIQTISIIGLPDQAIREAGERIQAAIEDWLGM